MKKVALVGFNPRTLYLAKDIPPDVEVWSLNWAWQYKAQVPRIDRLFEIHPKEYLYTKDENSQKHLDFLLNQEHPYPIYLIEANPEIKNSRVYPFDDVVAALAGNITRGDKTLKVFTSTFDYMMALAIFEGYGEIRLIGCEMDTQSEYGYQQPGFTYWMGQADSRGIKVIQPKETILLRSKTYHEGGAMIGRNTAEAHLKTHEAVQEQFIGEYNALLGQFQLLRQLHEQGRASVEEVNQARAGVLEAKSRVDTVVGAVQAIEILLKEFDTDEPEIKLDALAVKHIGKSDEVVKALSQEAELPAVETKTQRHKKALAGQDGRA